MFSLQQLYPSFSSIDQIAKKSSKKHQKIVKTKTKPKKSATTTSKPPKPVSWIEKCKTLPQRLPQAISGRNYLVVWEKKG